MFTTPLYPHENHARVGAVYTPTCKGCGTLLPDGHCWKAGCPEHQRWVDAMRDQIDWKPAYWFQAPDFGQGMTSRVPTLEKDGYEFVHRTDRGLVRPGLRPRVSLGLVAVAATTAAICTVVCVGWLARR